ncbi:MAG: pyruvate formate lyase-activating protein [Clostridioides sp.]|jgi:pyruvate formate lyase activating enzyme|nr:pyruvate formate lyase-activating protein [Clostridioides sp.]
MLKGKIHSIETFGTVDGPGIRYVIFFQGCPLKCKYCHNRDTWDTSGGKEYTVDELINDAQKYKSYRNASGGGMTISGGEPTLQPEFLTKLFKDAKKNKIHTCLDTCGFVDIGVVDPILDNTDLVMLDLKHMIDEECIKLTGVTAQKAKRLALHLRDRNIPVWIKHVLVPGISDTKENLEALGKFIASLTNVERVELLPYHSMGVHKWEELDIDYELKDIRDGNQEDIVAASKILNQFGVDVYNA